MGPTAPASRAGFVADRYRNDGNSDAWTDVRRRALCAPFTAYLPGWIGNAQPVPAAALRAFWKMRADSRIRSRILPAVLPVPDKP